MMCVICKKTINGNCRWGACRLANERANKK